MNPILSLLAASALALVLSAPRSQAQDPARRGHGLVKEFCADCHAIGRSGKSPNAAASPLRLIGRSYDLDSIAERLQRGISAGHPDMPEFIFDRADARAVQAYLRAIQR
jgi:mono/diheme cytochrome c family protein